MPTHTKAEKAKAAKAKAAKARKVAANGSRKPRDIGKTSKGKRSGHRKT